MLTSCEPEPTSWYFHPTVSTEENDGEGENVGIGENIGEEEEASPSSAEHFGLPFLSAYLDSYQTNFRQGANFALGGSSTRPDKSWSHFNLVRQNEFAFEFQKSTVEEARKSIPAIANATDEAVYVSNVPRIG
ncbi:hypothetical protein RHMOL_Rhmol08G0064500 [Rhododendron molle]|uniref:Uncharacterized protein n=1 Tax=Rhododendron molle TaxID=49168 RepID=A0ACC0MKS5_RHOML|nr:hypothetical protein RHMOL_Rhmol08G0064500 [Rhododendron molle]